MIWMILTGLMWSRVYARSFECGNEILHQQLIDLSLRGINMSRYYCLAGNLIPILSVPRIESSESYPRMKLIDTKCLSCGAPLKMKSKYDVISKCEYCGTTYRFERE